MYHNSLPLKMYQNGVLIEKSDLPDPFAEYLISNINTGNNVQVDEAIDGQSLVKTSLKLQSKITSHFDK